MPVLVAINMAMSADGKIATKDRGPVKLGSAADTRRMAELRAWSDIVVNGSATFRAYPYLLHVKEPGLVSEREASGRRAQPVSAVVASRLDLPRATPWESATQAERWVFCGKGASKTARSRLEKAGVKVIASRRERPAPEEILRGVEDSGLKRLLVEGGGELNASFLERGLVARIHLTVTPLLIGGRDAPTWFEGKGFPSGKFTRLRLSACRQEGDELYLTYEPL